MNPFFYQAFKGKQKCCYFSRAERVIFKKPIFDGDFLHRIIGSLQRFQETVPDIFNEECTKKVLIICGTTSAVQI